MRSMRSLDLKRAVAVATAAIFLAQNSPLAYGAETSLWTERRQAQARARTQENPPLLASLPGAAAAPISAQIIDRLPALRPSQPMGARPETARTVPSNLEDLVAAIPLTSAAVKESNVVPHADGTVVIVQDVHLNPEAQGNIARVLQSLINNGLAGLVGVEGAFTDFDFQWFRQHRDRTILKSLASDFLKRNLIAAPSFVGLTSDTPLPPFVGIDDPAGYRANVNAYLASVGARSAIQNDLGRAVADLAGLKRKIYSPTLASFDAVAAGYHDGTVDMGDYVDRLALVEPALPDTLRRFAQARALERRLDFAKVDLQRRTVVRRLAESLSQTELKDLLARSLALRTGALSYADYYDGLRSLCERKAIPLGVTPDFETYLRYVKLADSIDGETLFGDLARVEDALYSRLASTPGAVALAAVDRRVRLFRRLAAFSFTSDEWKRYEETRGDWASSLPRLPINDAERMRLAELPARLAPFESFYSEADRRSHLIVDHLLARSPATAGAARVLVLGGYHAELVAALLRERHQSTVIVQPKLTSVSGLSGTEYLSVFERDNTPLDRLYNGAKLSVAPDVVALGTPGARTAPVDRLMRISESVEESAHDGVEPPTELGIEETREADGTVKFEAPTVGGTVAGVHGNEPDTLDHIGHLTFTPKNGLKPAATWAFTRWFTRTVVNPILIPMLNRLGFSLAPVADAEISTRVAPAFETLATGVVFAAAMVTFGVAGLPTIGALSAIQSANLAYVVANIFFSLMHIGSLRTSQGPPKSRIVAFGQLFIAGLIFHAPFLLAGPAAMVTDPLTMAGLLTVMMAASFSWGHDTHFLYNVVVLGRAGPAWLINAFRTWPGYQAPTATVRDPLTGEMRPDLEVYRRYPLFSLSDPTTRFLAWLPQARALLGNIAAARHSFRKQMEDLSKNPDELRKFARGLIDSDVGLSSLSSGRTTMLVNALRDAEMYDLATEVYEKTPHTAFRMADINADTYMWNMARLSERQTGATRAATLNRAADHAETYLSNKKPGEVVSGGFRTRLAVIYRIRHETAERLRRAQVAMAKDAAARPANYDQLVEDYRELFPRDADLNQVAENSVTFLVIALGESLRGFRVEYAYFPGINAMSLALTMTDLLDDPSITGHEREMLQNLTPQQTADELRPMVYQSLRVAGGEQSTDYWVLAVLLEHAAMGGRADAADAIRRYVTLTIKFSRTAATVASTVGRLESILARRERHAETANDEATQALREAVAQMNARLAALRLGGDDKTPIPASSGIEAEDTNVNRQLRSTDLLLNKLFDFRGIDSNFVSGSADYGGQMHSTAIGRPDVSLATEILQRLNLYGESDYEKFDQEVNRFVARLISLVDPATLERWMEDLHSNRHKIFDAIQVTMRTFAAAKEGKESRTNVLADAAMCNGDCRPTDHIKQLLYDVWKKSNVKLAMDESWDILQRDQISPRNQMRFIARMGRLQSEYTRLSEARRVIENGETLSEAQWKDVSQRLVDRIQKNQMSPAVADRMRELVYALEIGAPLSKDDRTQLVGLIDTELAVLNQISSTYGRLVTELRGASSRLTDAERDLLQQDVVRQINLYMNWQLATLDLLVAGQQQMVKKYEDKLIEVGREKGTGADLKGKPLYSPTMQPMEDHTMNGLYRLRKTYVREKGTGRLVLVKVMDRFSLRDAFYHQVYNWENHPIRDITTVLEGKDPELDGGIKNLVAYEQVGEENGVPLYEPRVVNVRLRFTRYTGPRVMRMGQSLDENGQNRTWGLLMEELNFDELVSPERRDRAWQALLWMRDIIQIQDWPADAPAQDLAAAAKAGLDRLGTLLDRDVSDKTIEQEIARIRRLAQQMRDATGNPATPADGLVSRFEYLSSMTATWRLTYAFTRTVLNRLIVPTLNRLGVRMAAIADADVPTKVAPWFETMVSVAVYAAFYAAFSLGWIPGVSALPPLSATALSYVMSNVVFAALHTDQLRPAPGLSRLGVFTRYFAAGALFHLPFLAVGPAAALAAPGAALAGVVASTALSLIWGTSVHEAFNAAILGRVSPDIVVGALGTPATTPNRARAALLSAIRSLRAWLTPAHIAQSGLAAVAAVAGAFVVGPAAAVALVAATIAIIAGVRLAVRRVVAPPLSEAQRLARRLIYIFRNDEISPAQAADAILALTPVESLTQRPARAPATAPALRQALQSELRTAWQGGTLDADAAARIAELVFQLRFNPVVAGAAAAPAVPLAALGANDQAPTLFTSWISDEPTARDLARSLLEGDNAGKANRALALGVHKNNADRILLALRADPAIRALEAAGRLKFVIGDDTSNILTLLDQAKDVRALAGLGRPHIQFLLSEGVALPPNFFQLSPQEWARLRTDFVVHFVTKTLEAIPMEAGLLTDYQAFRMELTQA